MEAHYEPLPSTPEDGGFGGGGDAEGSAPPDALLGSEQWQWEGIPNLDQFFNRIYRYWEEKGFVVMLTSRVLNLLALAFTVAMSALLLLYVDWGALRADCLKRDTCDIWEAAIRRHPLSGGLTAWTGLAVVYLLLFSAYWLAALAHLVYEVRDLSEVKHFCNNKLGISERQISTMTWPEVAHRLVQVQRRHRLCMARDLSEHDIVARVMRRENYLIGMLNKGVLALSVPIPGLRRHLLLTKTLEWNLYWCVLDAMFDDHFRLKPAFMHNEQALRKRFRVMSVVNLAASPFLLVFLIIYFFMKNAEKFYHHPSSVGARRWSPLATWRLRELNELPHFIRHRLNASHKAAEAYIAQFPNPVLSHAARFVAFVAGSVAALLLVVTLIDERLLERDLFGRQLVWWVAVVGVVLALSRAFVIETGTAFDPEAALMEVVAHTHYLPRHWRGRAHTREVQQEFEALFQYKALLFLEELASILLTPLLLWFSLPQCAGSILSFVQHNTVHVEGVGDVCSLAAFDFQRHGNARYGSPAEAPKLYRSRQGKMEKSFLSFAATYPAWEPDAAGRLLLQQLAAAGQLQQQWQQQSQWQYQMLEASGQLPVQMAGGLTAGGGGGGGGGMSVLPSMTATSAGGASAVPLCGMVPLRGAVPQRLWPPGAPRQHTQAVAAALVAARGGGGSGGGSGIFGSAEFPGPGSNHGNGIDSGKGAAGDVSGLNAAALVAGEPATTIAGAGTAGAGVNGGGLERGSGALLGGGLGASLVLLPVLGTANPAVATSAPPTGDERLRASQLLLQSLYEQRKSSYQQQLQSQSQPQQQEQQRSYHQQQQQQHGVQHESPRWQQQTGGGGGGTGSKPPSAAAAGAAAGSPPLLRQQHHSHQQQQGGGSSHYQQQQRPTRQHPPGVASQAPARWGGERAPHPPSPHLQHQQRPGLGLAPPSPLLPAGGQKAAHLQAAAAAGSGSDAGMSPGRHSWLGRSPPTRARVAELSVLSRENSSSGERQTHAATAPTSGVAEEAAGGGASLLIAADEALTHHAPAAASAAGGARLPAPPLPPQRRGVDESAADPALTLDDDFSNLDTAAEADWLLHQHLLCGPGAAAGGLHSTSSTSSSGGAGQGTTSCANGSGSASGDGPPEFF